MFVIQGCSLSPVVSCRGVITTPGDSSGSKAVLRTYSRQSGASVLSCEISADAHCFYRLLSIDRYAVRASVLAESAFVRDKECAKPGYKRGILSSVGTRHKYTTRNRFVFSQ